MIDQLRAMAVFAKVAEAGSFRGAADLLGLSPSVISHHVSALEKSLGVALVYRTTRKLSLTDEGERLARHAQAMLSAASEGLDGASQETPEVRGRLRITAPAVFQCGPFISMAHRFMQLHPNLELEIDFSDAPRDLVASGFDLALRIGWLPDSSLKARKFHTGTQLLCASPAYLETKPAVRTPDDLAALDLISVSSLVEDMQLTERASGRTTTVRAPHRLSVNSGYAALRFAEEGAGLARIPLFLALDALNAGRLREVLPGWSLPDPSFYAVWPANAGSRSLTRFFVDFLASEIKANPPARRDEQEPLTRKDAA